METDEQQLEELKRWWQEHGRTVVAGLVLGLGSVTGWTYWRAHLDTQAEAVSVRYETLLSANAGGDHRGAVTQADALIAEHPDSAYAGLAALAGAHAAYKDGDAATARRLLQWASEHGGSFQVSSVARVRLARILGEQGEFDAALSQLDQVSGDEFRDLREEARGDVLAARNDLAAARGAYETALAGESLPSSARTRIQLKLDALATRGG